MGPLGKLSYRSSIHKKVVFGARDAWTLPQIQGEVGGDQEPPGNTWRYPMGSKIFLLKGWAEKKWTSFRGRKSIPKAVIKKRLSSAESS